jgi:hypothetical protein
MKDWHSKKYATTLLRKRRFDLRQGANFINILCTRIPKAQKKLLTAEQHFYAFGIFVLKCFAWICCWNRPKVLILFKFVERKHKCTSIILSFCKVFKVNFWKLGFPSKMMPAHIVFEKIHCLISPTKFMSILCAKICQTLFSVSRICTTK